MKSLSGKFREYFGDDSDYFIKHFYSIFNENYDNNELDYDSIEESLAEKILDFDI